MLLNVQIPLPVPFPECGSVSVVCCHGSCLFFSCDFDLRDGAMIAASIVIGLIQEAGQRAGIENPFYFLSA